MDSRMVEEGKPMENLDTRLNFLYNPYREETKAHQHSEHVRNAATVREARERSAIKWDLEKWLEKGAIEI
eukprot:3551711-Karenia_brevis.AAC.1